MRSRSIRLYALFALLAGVLVFGIAACGDDSSSDGESGGGGAATSSAPASDGSGEMTELAVGVYPSTDYAALFYGDKAGIFEKHGIKPKITQILTGTGLTAAITSGKADVGTNSPTSMSTAISNGVPVKMVTPATSMPTEGYVEVFVLKDSGIADFGDLEGKTAATVNLQGLFELGVRNAIQKQGGDPSKLKALAMAPTDEAAALEAGRVDAIVLQDPFATEAKKNPKFKALGNPFAQLDYTILSGGFFSSDKVLGEKADAIKRFKEAYGEATEAIAADENLARDVIPGFTKLDPAVVKSLTLPDFSTDVSEDSINPMLAQMKEYGWIKTIPAYDDIVWNGN